MFWLAGGGSLLLLVLLVVGLVDLMRNRHTMETPQIVVWVIVLVVLPVVGLVIYLLRRLSRSDAMLDSMDYQREHPIDQGRRPRLGKD